MSRPRSRQAQDTADVGLILEPEAEVSPEERLAAFFGDAGDEVRVTIYELGEDTLRDRSFLFAFAAGDAPQPDELLSQILAQYGPGLYEAIARDSAGKITLRQRFQLGSTRQRQKPRFELGTPPPSAPAAAAAGGELAAILAQQNRILEALANALTSRPPERDTLAIARELGQLREIFAPAAPPAPTQTLREVVQDLLSVLSLRDQLAGGGADENPLTAAVRTLGPAIMRAVDRFSPPGAQAGGPAAPGAPASEGPPSSAPAPSSPPDAPMLKQVLANVFELAESGIPPAHATEHLLAALAAQPAWIEQAALAYLDELGDNAADKLIAAEPRLSRHRDWVQQTLAAIGAALEDSDATSTPPPAANGAPAKHGNGSARRA